MSSPDNWPKRANGTNKTIGEMTRDEKDAVFAGAAARLRAEMEDPAHQAAVQRVLENYGRDK